MGAAGPIWRRSNPVSAASRQSRQTSPSEAIGEIAALENRISVGGDRPEQNNYRLDGVSIVDFNNAAPGSVLGGDLGVDAVQEFSVLTSNVSAEYGRTSGGVINAVTRSGTNEFHGAAY